MFKTEASVDLVRVDKRGRNPAQFLRLADVPPEEEWLANITNPKTRRAYKGDVREFVAYAGLSSYAELRAVVRAHVIDWRKDMERRELGPATIRRKLSALSSLFDYLCERNAVAGNPVEEVKRPAANGNEGSTPALGDAQSRQLLDAPLDDTVKGRAMSTVRLPLVAQYREADKDSSTAGSASEAFDCFLASHPGVLVCDIGMHGEDGCSFIRRLRRLEVDESASCPRWR